MVQHLQRAVMVQHPQRVVMVQHQRQVVTALLLQRAVTEEEHSQGDTAAEPHHKWADMERSQAVMADKRADMVHHRRKWADTERRSQADTAIRNR
jgi:hypothetical protein